MKKLNLGVDSSLVAALLPSPILKIVLEALIGIRSMLYLLVRFVFLLIVLTAKINLA